MMLPPISPVVFKSTAVMPPSMLLTTACVAGAIVCEWAASENSFFIAAAFLTWEQLISITLTPCNDSSRANRIARHCQRRGRLTMRLAVEWTREVFPEDTGPCIIKTMLSESIGDETFSSVTMFLLRTLMADRGIESLAEK